MQRRDFLAMSSLASLAALVPAQNLARTQENHMRKLMVFNQVSLDGYFTDRAGDMSWAHRRDPEWMKFQSENAGGDAELVFGRITYEMMASFWPTPQARETMPQVADAMNRMRKSVFSRTLEHAAWQNTRVVKGDLVTEVHRMKAEPGPDLVLMGSGQIIAQLTQAQLIDEYQIVVTDTVLGSGRTMFEGVTSRPGLTLTKTRSFDNGNVVLWYTLST
ncbi:MAG: dihydrofolate reductase family protein [Povalibacter sp.]